MTTLDSLVNCAPLFPQFILEDCHFTISDTEKFLVSIPGKTLKMAIKVGDILQDRSITKIAIERKEKVVVEGNKELYGIAHIALCTPIIENNKAIGCVSIGYSMEKADKINQMAEALSSMVEQISSSSQSVAAASQELASKNEELSTISVSVRDKMNAISDIVAFVLQIASKTNILGLNADIQAAHAGEYGKAFSVVAKEIRKLAYESQQSSDKIKQEISMIQHSILDILDEIQSSAGFTEELAAAAEKLSASMDDLNITAKDLFDLSLLGKD